MDAVPEGLPVHGKDLLLGLVSVPLGFDEILVDGSIPDPWNKPPIPEPSSLTFRGWTHGSIR